MRYGSFGLSHFPSTFHVKMTPMSDASIMIHAESNIYMYNSDITRVYNILCCVPQEKSVYQEYRNLTIINI
jgi:hypothetical protein